MDSCVCEAAAVSIGSMTGTADTQKLRHTVPTQLRQLVY